MGVGFRIQGVSCPVLLGGTKAGFTNLKFRGQGGFGCWATEWCLTWSVFSFSGLRFW